MYRRQDWFYTGFVLCVFSTGQAHTHTNLSIFSFRKRKSLMQSLEISLENTSANSVLFSSVIRRFAARCSSSSCAKRVKKCSRPCVSANDGREHRSLSIPKSAVQLSSSLAFHFLAHIVFLQVHVYGGCCLCCPTFPQEFTGSAPSYMTTARYALSLVSYRLAHRTQFSFKFSTVSYRSTQFVPRVTVFRPVFHLNLLVH